jgi:hypothetical protein
MGFRGFLYAIVLVYAVAPIVYAEQRFPVIKSDEDRIRLILSIQQYVPSLLSLENSNKDFFTLFDSADQLTRSLDKIPKYHELLEEKGPELVITMKGKGSDGVERKINAPRLDDMKVELTTALESLKGETTQKALQAAIENSTKNSLANGNAQGFLTGLINTLSPKARGQVFKAQYNEQLKLLSEMLPDDVIEKGFKAENFGIEEEKLSRDEALKLLQQKKASEEELVQLVKLDAALRLAKTKDAPLETIKKQISAWTPDTLKPILEAGDAFKPVNDSLLADYGKMPGAKGVLERVDRDMKALVDVTKVQNAKPSKVPTLILREAPPWIGIFRGCAGGDCSTSHSWAYGVSPTDRVFLVTGEDGQLKGYTHGVILETDGKRSLFIHTIAGPKISADNTYQILQGMDMAKNRLGVQEITISDGGGSRINYAPIVKVFQELAKNSAPKATKIIDSAVRPTVDAKSNASYDKSDGFKTAYPLRVPKDEEHTMDVEVREAGEAKLKDKISKGDALMLVADLRALGNNGAADRVAKAMKVTAQDVTDFSQIISNEKALPVQEYLDSVMAHFKELGLPTTKDFLQSKETALMLGYLKAPDATKGQNASRALDYVFRLNDGNPTVVANLIRPIVDALLETPKMKNYITRKVADPNTNLNQFKQYFLGGDKNGIVLRGLLENFAGNNDAVSKHAATQLSAYLLNGSDKAPLEKALAEIRQEYQKTKNPNLDPAIFRERFATAKFQQNWIDQNMPAKPKENAPLAAGLHLTENDTIVTPKGANVRVLSVLDRGSKTSLYLVQDKKGAKQLLTMANTQEPKPLEKISKEVQRTNQYEKLQLPHLRVNESNDWFLLKEYGEGMTGQEWLDSKEKDKGGTKEEVLARLGELLGELTKKGLYVGHLEPEDLFYDGQRWKLLRSGSIEEGQEMAKAGEKYVAKFADRWSESFKEMLQAKINEAKTTQEKEIAAQKPAEETEPQPEKETEPVPLVSKKPKSEKAKSAGSIVEEEVVEVAPPKMKANDKYAQAWLDALNQVKNPGKKPVGEQVPVENPFIAALKNANGENEEKPNPKVEAPKQKTEAAPAFPVGQEVPVIALGGKYKKDQILRTPAGRTLQIMDVVDEGSKTKDYIVRDPRGRRFFLKVATEHEKGRARIAKDTERAQLYAEHELPHFAAVESSPNFVLKEYAADVQTAKSFLKTDPANNNERLQSLRNVFSELIEAGIYVGHLEPKDVLWDGEAWKIIDSGSVETGLDPDEARDKYEEKFPDRWGKNAASKLRLGAECDAALGNLAQK